MFKTFEALDAALQTSLKEDLAALIASLDKAADGTMVVPGEYLEVVVVKR